MGVGEHHHQHQYVPHNTNQEDEKIGKIHPQLDWHQEYVQLVFFTDWPLEYNNRNLLRDNNY